jgi:hypothetical protein
MKKTTITLTLLASLAIASQRPGAVFLMIWPGARPTGLGGAFSAVADDASANYYNPGGLAFINSTVATLQHSNWLPGLYAGMYYEYMGFGHSIKDKGTVGFDVIYLSTGKTEVTGVGGINYGEYTTFDIALGPSYGFKLKPNLGFGMTFKLIYSYLVPSWVWTIPEIREELGINTGGTGVSWAFDAGLLYKISSKISIGASLQNFGPNISYTDTHASDPLPRMLRAGLRYEPLHTRLFKLLITPEINKVLVGMFYDPEDTLSFFQELGYELNESWKSLGVEFWYFDMLSLRVGYFEDATGARGGLVFNQGGSAQTHITLADYLFGGSAKRSGDFSGLGFTLGGGVKFKGFQFDIGVDQWIYDFPTSNYKFSLSYHL